MRVWTLKELFSPSERLSITSERDSLRGSSQFTPFSERQLSDISAPEWWTVDWVQVFIRKQKKLLEVKDFPVILSWWILEYETVWSIQCEYFAISQKIVLARNSSDNYHSESILKAANKHNVRNTNLDLIWTIVRIELK